MKKILISTLLGSVLYGCSTAPKQQPASPPSLKVVTVQPQEVTTFQEYPASVQGVDNVDIRPQVSGILEEVFVDEGAFVKEGQPLFRIDERPFRAALGNAIASLHAAQGAAVNADLEVEKLTPLVQNKVVSDYQLKNAKAAADIARANIEQAKANITTAQINLNYTLIKAPVSGYIGRMLRKKGNLIGPNDPAALTALSDVHNVHVYFALAEKDFVDFKDQYPGATLDDKIKQLAPVSLVLTDSKEFQEKGRVDMIDGQFDKNTGAIDVRAIFPNPQGLLRDGNTGKIKLSLLHKTALTIPQSSTMELQDQVYVFAVGDSNKVKKVFISITGKAGKAYLVGDGLKAGDRVVIEGIGTLQEGMIIHPEAAVEKIAVLNK
ncbi:efflux RND transporter periplasmic adaptor subunit [Mucilaginibacter sp. cycad4]|uniref:efflux RND transporter periplasmic adaptor subunit n=1 Tax=Mucilaginibacter sp. cycad4 TaxID=3342096 RepID=UPI002AAB5099|nr:efflux RND transporter periplasmic adaptor subunit [Mucilaginibacter gossypii]WPU99141.1 efflux RND transporter periplasmic adaptor subunit [Mucilaginibacter gossypii]